MRMRKEHAACLRCLGQAGHTDATTAALTIDGLVEALVAVGLALAPNVVLGAAGHRAVQLLRNHGRSAQDKHRRQLMCSGKTCNMFVTGHSELGW